MDHIIHFGNDVTLWEQLLKCFMVFLNQSLQIGNLVFANSWCKHNSCYLQQGAQQIPVLIILRNVIPHQERKMQCKAPHLVCKTVIRSSHVLVLLAIHTVYTQKQAFTCRNSGLQFRIKSEQKKLLTRQILLCKI